MARAEAKPPAGDIKARIDRAALHLFAEIGVAATPVPLIAERAGVAVGSLYRYYENKEDLVERLYAENYAAMADRLSAVQASEQTAAARIAAMIRLICSTFDEEWDLARFLLLEQHVRLKHYELAANPVEVVQQVMADGIRSGELRAMDPALAAALVMGPVLQAATFRTYGRLTDPLSDIADELVKGCLCAVANRGEVA